ncbi:MAG: hypothetical protein ACRYHQ_24425 [Janthinobacterium lividum]
MVEKADEALALGCIVRWAVGGAFQCGELVGIVPPGKLPSDVGWMHVGNTAIAYGFETHVVFGGEPREYRWIVGMSVERVDTPTWADVGPSLERELRCLLRLIESHHPGAELEKEWSSYARTARAILASVPQE